MGHPASRLHWSRRAHSWTGPYKVLIVGPGKVPDGDLVSRRNLLLLDTSHEDSRRINARVSVHRCKRCYNPHEAERRPQFLPWATSSYVLNKCSDPSPPFHLTVDDVDMESRGEQKAQTASQKSPGTASACEGLIELRNCARIPRNNGVVVVVSHIQRIGCQPKKTTLHGGQSRSWSAEQGKRKKEKVWQRPPPPARDARSEKIKNKK